ncbi:MAG: hypothetical protein AB2A00_19115 [Myxococcota bacterium]
MAFPTLAGLGCALALLAACSGSNGQCSANDECDAWEQCVGGACVLASAGSDAATSLDAGPGDTPDAAQSPGDSGNPSNPTDAAVPDAAVPDAAAAPDAAVPDASEPPDPTDASTGPAPDAASHPDAGSPRPRDAGGGLLGCQPDDNDDVLSADELPVALNIPIRFHETRPEDGVAVNLHGQVEADGGTSWHFNAELPGDTLVEIEATALEDHWFASEFPPEAYVATLDGTGENLGVFRRDTTGISLLGVASREPDYTLLTYDPPVLVAPFPLALGATFSTTTQTSGTFEGNAFYMSTDTYEATVDARGRVFTRAGAFPALRIRVIQQVRVPVPWWPFELNYQYIRHTFMSPCIGQVASVESFEGEEDPMFSTAAVVRRLGLGQ